MRSVSLAALAAAMLVLGACKSDVTPESAGTGKAADTAKPVSGGGKVVASWGDETLTTEEFLIEVERMPPRARTQLSAPERRRQFVDSFVMNDLLVEQGRAKGYDEDPDIERQVDDLRRRLIVQRVMKDFQEPPQIPDDEVQKYYEENKRLFSGAQVKASHILVKDEALAKQLREQIQADPAKFEELAKQHSVDSATAQRGGDLGFFGQGRMVADFERAAFVMEPGQISEVVKTPFGYHIIKVVERKEGPERPFTEVKDRIRVSMLNQRRQDQVSKQFEDMKSKANVTVNEEVLAEIEIPAALLQAPASGPGMGMPGGH
jgi:peptidyl-prolyl cis-trans isomerase C